MPDNEITVAERTAFEKWLEDTYGMGTAIRIGKLGFQTTDQLRKNEYYQYWDSIGKPGLRVGPLPETAPLTERGAVARQWMTPEGGYDIPPEAQGAFEKWRPTQGAPQPEWTAGYEDLWAQAEAIAARTGRPVADVFASLTGTPPPETQEAEGMTAYQQWQVGFQERQLGHERQMTQQNLLAEQWNAQRARWAVQSGRPREDMASQSAIWEAAQRERLAGLTGEQDWIKKWQAQQTRNPYAPPESNVEQASEYYDETKAEYTRRKAAANIIRKRMQDPRDPLYEVAFGNVETPEQWYAQQVIGAERTAEDKFLEAESELEGETYSWGGKLSEGLPTGEGGRAYGFEDRPPGPWHPATPQWLSKMYPKRTEEQMWGTRLGGGKPSPLAAPSGQAWGRLAPSQQAGWMGYAEYTGGKPQDLLTQMWKMQPRTPQVAQRWQPAKQRA